MYEPLTKEELKSVREQEQKMYEEMEQQKKEEAKEKRRKKIEDMKQAMKKPVPPIPVTELCPYEKLREKIIKEREALSHKPQQSQCQPKLSKFVVNVVRRLDVASSIPAPLVNKLRI